MTETENASVEDNNKIKLVAELPETVSELLPHEFDDRKIYQSLGLEKHIKKKHENCIDYIDEIPNIITEPDCVGVNPNEKDKSFELVKIFDDNIQIGIKLDVKNNYRYVASLYDITQAKLDKGLENGRLKNVDKQR